MQISKTTAGEWTVVAPVGEIDLATADAVDEVLRADLDTVLDLTGVTFMDSTGLRTLIGVHNRLTAADLKLRIVVSGGAVARIIEIAGLTGELALFSSVDEATS